ncbi:MAG TPA: hypothetical protein ENK38_02530 [Gammaproteobacteria bacterium]|nr:hypothetical protein [Gammaproteobacteria bacterium]
MVKKAHILALASAGFLLVPLAQAEVGHNFTDALTGGKASVDMRFRMENVTQESKPEDANALTLRTRLGYLTGDYEGFKAFGEMTHTAAIENNDYLVPKGPGANGKTDYPVVADPEISRLNQAWVSYSGIANTAVKLGRQRVKLDNDRFVGNVGWRQTEQVYDALVVANTSIQDTTLIYGYVTRAYTIFGTEVPSQSHLVNVSYNGFSFGKITGYAYLLDLLHDSGAADSQTLGLRFGGKQALSDDFTLLYALELAQQSEYADAPSTVDADYTKFELGGKFMGVTAKIGQEKLGGDGTYGFQTILATKHAFNGWADKFLTTPADGLVDNYFSVGGKPAGIKLLAVYHTFTADNGGDDYGKELNLLAAKKFGKNYTVGLKYANYTDDTVAADDVSKVWLWGQLKF